MNLHRNPEIVWRVEKRREADVIAAMERGEDVSEHGTVILIAAGAMHQLNFVAGRIWNLCDGSRSDDEIFGALAEEFSVDPAELKADLNEFLNDLIKREWLQRG